jgi:hypothetical protein
MEDEDYLLQRPGWLTLIDEAKVGTSWERSAVLTATWSTLSGMSHFSHAKAMTLLDKDVIGEPKGDGVRNARATANVGTTVSFLVNTMALYAAAGERLRLREPQVRKTE